MFFLKSLNFNWFFQCFLFRNKLDTIACTSLLRRKIVPNFWLKIMKLSVAFSKSAAILECTYTEPLDYPPLCYMTRVVGDTAVCHCLFAHMKLTLDRLIGCFILLSRFLELEQILFWFDLYVTFIFVGKHLC